MSRIRKNYWIDYVTDVAHFTQNNYRDLIGDETVSDVWKYIKEKYIEAKDAGNQQAIDKILSSYFAKRAPFSFDDSEIPEYTGPVKKVRKQRLEDILEPEIITGPVRKVQRPRTHYKLTEAIPQMVEKQTLPIQRRQIEPEQESYMDFIQSIERAKRDVARIGLKRDVLEDIILGIDELETELNEILKDKSSFVHETKVIQPNVFGDWYDAFEGGKITYKRSKCKK